MISSLPLFVCMCVCVSVLVHSSLPSHSWLLPPIFIHSFGFLLHNNNIMCERAGARNEFTTHVLCSVWYCMNEMRLGENYFQFVFCTSLCCRALPRFSVRLFYLFISVRCNSQSDLNYWFNQWLFSFWYYPLIWILKTGANRGNIAIGFFPLQWALVPVPVSLEPVNAIATAA